MNRTPLGLIKSYDIDLATDIGTVNLAHLHVAHQTMFITLMQVRMFYNLFDKELGQDFMKGIDTFAYKRERHEFLIDNIPVFLIN